MTDTNMDHLRTWIGREETRCDIITPELTRRFCATLALDCTVPASGEPAPRLIHFCLAQPAVRADGLGADGHPRKGGFLPPVDLPRRMWAGGSVRFSGELRVGEEVLRTSRIADIKEKTGRSGRLFFVTVDHEVLGSAGSVTERQDIVYREAATGPVAASASASAPAPKGQLTEELVADATLLFRYSALTFNGHRIHYDRSYATGTEYYSGLVVHGPLQATLLYHLAARWRGQAPSGISFRGQSALTEGHLTLNAADEGAMVRLWTAAPDGPVAMSAEVDWS